MSGSEPEATNSAPSKSDLLYIVVEVVMTPLNQKQGYKEAKVGVIFWSKDHQKIKGQRGRIRRARICSDVKIT